MNDKKIIQHSITKKEIIRYCVAGMFVGATDFGIYYILLNVFPYSLSKGISFICAGIVAYLFNKYWTFEQLRPSRAEIMRFVMINVLMLEINVLVNQSILSLWPGKVFVALLLAGQVTNILAFVFFKFWVFRR